MLKRPRSVFGPMPTLETIRRSHSESTAAYYHPEAVVPMRMLRDGSTIQQSRDAALLALATDAAFDDMEHRLVMSLRALRRETAARFNAIRGGA